MILEDAYQMTHRLKTLYQLKEASIEDWDKAVAKAEQYRIYERVPPGYPSLDALLLAEIGRSVRQGSVTVRQWAAMAEDAPPLPVPGEVGNGRSSPYPVSSTSYGNNATYMARRIKRDRPDIFDRMKAGEFATVAAAAIEAGFRKRTITITLEPEAAALSHVGRPTKQEQEERDKLRITNFSGQTRDYNTARLARDRPDLHARVLAGEAQGIRTSLS